jgi:hypothetical protein
MARPGASDQSAVSSHADAISLGLFAADINKDNLSVIIYKRENKKRRTAWAGKFLAHTSLNFRSELDDVADPVVFFCSDLSKYIAP